MIFTSTRKPLVIGKLKTIDYDELVYENIMGLYSELSYIDRFRISEIIHPIVKYDKDNFPELSFYERTLHVTFQQARVKEGDTHKDSNWHIDSHPFIGFKIVRQYIVCSIFPTEFLLKEIAVECDSKITFGSLIRANGSQMLIEGGEIWSPKPYEIILTNNHIHRSPKVKKTCDRSFLRVTILEID